MKRITFIVGHYGSGKSEFALNLAVQKHVDLLIDLDIVNPYFRSRELGVELAEKNIRFVSSPIKGLGSDLPYIAKEAFLPFYRNLTSIFDLGGDDVGTKVARQFFELINYETTDFLFCVNVYREETDNSEKIIKMMEKIEKAGSIKLTGLINNTNLLRETSYQDLLIGEKILEEVEQRTGLKIVYTGVYENVLPECGKLAGEIIPLKLYLRKKWL
ncbi:MAG TPA: ATP-binding protein [Acholeplasmataceae bacterium]|jgi:hypothetical protein|nr:ATP-binding protein [Acholeplasmataceae bacterium]